MRNLSPKMTWQGRDLTRLWRRNLSPRIIWQGNYLSSLWRGNCHLRWHKEEVTWLICGWGTCPLKDDKEVTWLVCGWGTFPIRWHEKEVNRLVLRCLPLKRHDKEVNWLFCVWGTCPLRLQASDLTSLWMRNLSPKTRRLRRDRTVPGSLSRA